MLNWEVHALRGLVNVILVGVQLYARSYPEAAGLAASMVEAREQMLLNQAAEIKARRGRVVGCVSRRERG